MRKSVLTLSVAALALTGATIAFAQHRDHPNPDTDGDGIVTLAEMQAHGAGLFGRMDANGDGVLDEADRAGHGAEKFARADTNGDGELTPDEMKAAHEARMEARQERREARAAKHEERMAEHFAAADTDKSGGLSQDELRAMHEARGERGEGPRHGRGGPHAGPDGKGGPHMLLKMADANGDKAVTRAEFDTAIAAHFARMDADGNGSVSKDEMQAAHKSMRQHMRDRREARSES